MSIDNISSYSSAGIGQSSYQSAKSSAKIDEFSSLLDEATTTKDDEKMMEACQEFESYFVQSMYKEMQKTLDDSKSLFKKSQAENTFSDFLVEEHAKNIAGGQGIGIAQMMFDSMKKQQDAIDPSSLL